MTRYALVGVFMHISTHAERRSLSLTAGVSALLTQITVYCCVVYRRECITLKHLYCGYSLCGEGDDLIPAALSDAWPQDIDGQEIKDLRQN